jgi:hypothetical protein
MAGVGRTVGVPALLCVLALVGCTPDPGGPTPFPTPTATQTPSESAQERQERLDYAAAERAYRTFRAEYGRVLRAGGAKEPTKVMKATAGGDYLNTFSDVIRGYRKLGSHATGKEKIVFVRPRGHEPRSLALDVCEDDRMVRTIRRSRTAGHGDLRQVELQLRRTNEGWKIWSGKGEVVESCD